MNPDIRPLTLPEPATPAFAYPDGRWSASRIMSLEGPRRAYADEVMLADDICYQQDMTIRRQGDEIARLRAHLAAAGLALDALTAQLAEHRAVGDRLAAGMAMGGSAGGCEGCDCCDPEAAR